MFVSYIGLVATIMDRANSKKNKIPIFLLFQSCLKEWKK